MELKSEILFNDTRNAYKAKPATAMIVNGELKCTVDNVGVLSVPVASIEKYGYTSAALIIKVAGKNYQLLFAPVKKIAVYSMFGLLGYMLLSKKVKSSTDFGKWIEFFKSSGVSGGLKIF